MPTHEDGGRQQSIRQNVRMSLTCSAVQQTAMSCCLVMLLLQSTLETGWESTPGFTESQEALLQSLHPPSVHHALG
jgi:hypothetical protein